MSQSFAVQFTMSGGMKKTTRDETTETRVSRAERTDDAPPRRLFVMRSAARLFAVYADEVAATSENLTPTPLPFAPVAVRGVVSQRGRILTLIDPLPLLPVATPTAAETQPFTSPAMLSSAPFVVVLKGDEQLALAVEAVEHEIELYDTEADAVPGASGGSLLRRTIAYHTHAVALLNPARLFDAAMQGVERRRQRT
jgi:chemotaxis signal transduction protein